MTDVLQPGGLSDAERALFLERLYTLLRQQSACFLSGDGAFAPPTEDEPTRYRRSTSLPVETAEELLRSLVFTLRFALAQTGKPERALVTEDLETLLAEGRRLLKDKLADTRRLFDQARLTVPPVRNAFLDDTLREGNAFFAHYNARYFAHQIPWEIDYPLAVPVPEERHGVSYAHEWLRRLLTENMLLHRFPAPAIRKLLTKITDEYAEYPLNLCEPVLLNAVGLTLLGKSAFPLVLTKEDGQKLEKRFSDHAAIRDTLADGAARTAAALRATPDAEAYLGTVVMATAARLDTGAVHGVFVIG